ncbi:MAG TPA: TonB-dependent receptor [Terracidiphilus sp.]|nr:TonB-dependent receptor [Terracidiphilus sp.]
MRFLWTLAVLCLLTSLPCSASVFARLHGVVHDPQHRPIAGAKITLKAANSEFKVKATSNALGEFELPPAPIGLYTLTVEAPGFATFSSTVTLTAATNPLIHIPMSVGSTSQTVTVEGGPASNLSVDSVTPTTMVTREQIDETPGASRTLGMAMITDYVPGAYMSHDMLHMRGGHQTSWLIDGVSIPNTKIASNVGPQIDPKDIDTLEVERGSYAADVGDRTYGVFNVLPRNGFERDREGELRLSGGNLGTGEAQLSFGNHTARTAWYASATGSRSNYGLETPVPEIVHDSTNSESGFVSVIRNQTERDQLRLDGQYRQDYFQIPYDPDPNDWEQSADYYNSYGLRDGQTERDGFAILNWVRTLSSKALFQIAPFVHFNQALYDSRPSDYPVATTWHQTTNYAGLQADVQATAGSHHISGGVYSFFQTESDLFGLVVNDASYADNSVPNTSSDENAGLVEFHFGDHWQVNRYIALLGGMRISNYHGGLEETAAYPRIGATVRVPKLNWVFRGFYGHFFQPAPIQTVSSAFLNYVNSQEGENTFVPLPSERDEEHQFGVQIPWKGWMADIDTFRTRINNFLDHSNVGESNIYFPIAVDGALVRGWELALRSPQLARIGQFHLAYSNQIAEQRGAIIGGFTCSDANSEDCNDGFDYEPVDHDQRDTLNVGFTANPVRQTWFATNVYYGSGFANGLAGSGLGPYQGDYLPVHTTFDVSAGHSFGEDWKASVSVLNATNHRVLIDNSVTVGGFHWNDPRMISGELRYQFHF